MGGSWNGARGSPPTELVESSAKLQHIQFSLEKAGWKNGGALQPAVGGEARTNRVFAFAKKKDEDADYYVREGELYQFAHALLSRPARVLGIRSVQVLQLIRAYRRQAAAS